MKGEAGLGHRPASPGVVRRLVELDGVIVLPEPDEIGIPALGTVGLAAEDVQPRSFVRARAFDQPFPMIEVAVGKALIQFRMDVRVVHRLIVLDQSSVLEGPIAGHLGPIRMKGALPEVVAEEAVPMVSPPFVPIEMDGLVIAFGEATPPAVLIGEVRSEILGLPIRDRLDGAGRGDGVQRGCLPCNAPPAFGGLAIRAKFEGDRIPARIDVRRDRGAAVSP